MIAFSDKIDTNLLRGLGRICEVARVGARSLKRGYDFHRFSSTEPQIKEPVPTEERSRCEEAMCVAVHSLELHLLSCLKR